MKKVYFLVILFLGTVVSLGLGSEFNINVKFKQVPTLRQIGDLESQLNITKISGNMDSEIFNFAVTEPAQFWKIVRTLREYDFVDNVQPVLNPRAEKVRIVRTVLQEKAGSGDLDTLAEVQPFYKVTSIDSVPNEVIVKFRESRPQGAVSALAQKVGIQAIAQIPQLNIEVYQIVSTRTVGEVLTSLRADPNVEYAEPNYILHALEIPNDPDFNKLWGLNNEGQNGGQFDADIDAPEAWDREKGKKAVIVSVIDTGIDYTHPDLIGNMWVNQGEIPNNGQDDDLNGFIDDYLGWDFVNNDSDPMDDNRHGTHCAGTIGALGNNGIGVVGVNWVVTLMPLKFLNSGGSGSTSNAIKAIIYAADNGANIMSNSWGGGGSSQALKEAIEYANDKGALFIAAAGNESSDNDNSPSYPSNYDVENVIAVAATDNRDELANFSNYGATTVDLSAPGVNIYSTVPGGYQYLSGTSMATPHVAGAAALVWAGFLPDVNQAIVKYRLFGAVDYVRNLENKVLLDGRLNVNNSLSDNPLIAVIEKPFDTSDETGPYPVEASIVDNDTITVGKLFYRISGTTNSRDTLTLTTDKPYVYKTNIPGAKKGSSVEYKIFARDTDGNYAESRFYTFRVDGTTNGGGCCGSAAATIQTGEPVASASLTFLLNILLIFGPLTVLKFKLKRK
ncbi:MAG: S8 family peptidase [Calditrichia bacterium]